MVITDEVLQFYGGPYDGGVVMIPFSAGRVTLEDSFKVVVQRNTSARTLPSYLQTKMTSQGQQHGYIAVGYVPSGGVALVTMGYIGSQANGLQGHAGQEEEGRPEGGDSPQEAEGQEEKVDGT